MDTIPNQIRLDLEDNIRALQQIHGAWVDYVAWYGEEGGEATRHFICRKWSINAKGARLHLIALIAGLEAYLERCEHHGLPHNSEAFLSCPVWQDRAALLAAIDGAYP